MSIAMTWWQFRNSGNAVTNSAVVLGVMPQGQLLNAMEITFREEDAAARGRAMLKGYCNYRVRQTLEEQDFQFVNGQWRIWARQAQGTADDPDPAVQSWNPPFLRMIDTPGWSAFLGVGPNTRQLIVNWVRSDINATEVWVQQIFKTWVQGQDCFTNVWSDVSIKVTWHNSLRLIRDNSTSPWRAVVEKCRISHGPMAFGTAALL
jgi:hypothetical protein